MAVSDLTNTKWILNNAPAIFENTFSYSINFTSNNTNYTTFASVDDGGDLYILKYNSTAAFEDWDGATTWYNEAYKTIEITGGTDVTNSTLITWLTANATQVIETTTDIVLGNNTLTGVDTIKLTDASDDSNKIDFTYGVTPSGTINVKLGGNTLVGVNEILVRGTDNISKSFGYAEQAPSEYTIRIIGYNSYSSGEYCVNNGAWTSCPTTETTLTNVYKLEIRRMTAEVDTYYIYDANNVLIQSGSLQDGAVDVTQYLQNNCLVKVWED